MSEGETLIITSPMNNNTTIPQLIRLQGALVALGAAKRAVHDAANQAGITLDGNSTLEDTLKQVTKQIADLRLSEELANIDAGRAPSNDGNALAQQLRKFANWLD